jgi:hypothetical protein
MNALNGQTDLYTALRCFAKATGTTDLATVMDMVDPTTAARLASVDAGILTAILRAGAGLPAIEAAPAIIACLDAAAPSPLFLPEITKTASIALPTRGERPDMPAFSDRAFDTWFAAQNVPYGIGLYGENRTVYATDQASPERLTVHLGIDVFAPAGTPLYAPLSGKVLHLTYNADPLDYGHTLIMEHDVAGVRFFTLYGHLGGSLPGLLRVGQSVEAGQLMAHLGDWTENGGWAAHVHFQVMTTMLAQDQGNFFGVGHQSLWDIWSQICPDPNLILRLPATRFAV